MSRTTLSWAAAGLVAAAACWMPASGQDIRQPQGAQRHGQRPSGGQAQGARPQAPAQPQVHPLQPSWAPLAPHHAKHVHDILLYWEKRSAKIKTFRCDFKRFKYDPVFVPVDPKTGELPAQEISEGEIKYTVPDKALYKDTKTWIFQPPKQPGGKPQWKVAQEDYGNHWVCDGESIIEFDAANKQVLKTVLPPDLQGNVLLTHGPLPFLFGAKAADIQRRYWIRVVTPQGTKDQYHLEAYPKLQADAANFKCVRIVLDRKMYLPVQLVIYNVNFDPIRNPARTAYVFENREENPFDIAKFNPWKKDFYEPPVPKGWTLVPTPMAAQQGARR